MRGRGRASEAGAKKLTLRGLGFWRWIGGADFGFFVSVSVEGFAEEVEEPVGEACERGVIAEPSEESVIEADESWVIGPLANEVKLFLLEVGDGVVELNIFEGSPPALGAKVLEILHLGFVDLHNLAANAIGGDEIIGAEDEVHFDDIAEHWSGAIESEAAIDDGKSVRELAIKLVHDLGKVGVHFQADRWFLDTAPLIFDRHGDLGIHVDFRHGKGDEGVDFFEHHFGHGHLQSPPTAADWHPLAFGKADIDDLSASLFGELIDAHAFKNFIDGKAIVSTAVGFPDDHAVAVLDEAEGDGAEAIDGGHYAWAKFGKSEIRFEKNPSAGGDSFKEADGVESGLDDGGVVGAFEVLEVDDGVGVHWLAKHLP